LRPVAVPTEEEEADRQVIRLRDQAVQNRRRVRQRIKSFLLMHSLPEPRGLEHWSAAGVTALGAMEIRNGRLRFCLDVLLEELANADETLAKIDHEMKAMAEEPRHAAAVKTLTDHVGVGRTTALQFETEMYRPERFSNERQVSAMLGLAPRVRQSGERRREGPLIKAGRGRLRTLLVEAAWVWIQHDPQARKVYQRLVRNTGSAQKAIVGMARRLELDLWRGLVKARAAA
jgi:transposase